MFFVKPNPPLEREVDDGNYDEVAAGGTPPLDEASKIIWKILRINELVSLWKAGRLRQKKNVILERRNHTTSHFARRPALLGTLGRVFPRLYTTTEIMTPRAAFQRD